MSEESVSTINNLNINETENYISVTVDPKIFSMGVIFSAAYIFIDTAYVVITGDPEKQVFVALRPKKKKLDLEELGRDFNNELLNYAAYFYQSEVNKDIRNAIVQKALFPDAAVCEENNNDSFNAGHNELVDDTSAIDNLDYADDPLGISKPWDEESTDKDKDKDKEKDKEKDKKETDKEE